MKILIIQTAFIGDVVLATPLIEKLAHHYPDATIDMLVRRGNESLLLHHPLLREIIIHDKKKKYSSLWKIIRFIRGQRYDHVINVQRFFTTGLITVLSGAGNTIGFDKNPLSPMFDHAVRHIIATPGDISDPPIVPENETTHFHEVQRNLQLIDTLVPQGFVRPKLYPSATDFEKTAHLQNYVCIAPASVWFTKQFPEHKWMELIQHLPQDITVCLIGAKGDIELCERIRSNFSDRNIIILAGQLSMLESAALMAKAKMNYVNDSAPLHFASAVNAPVTAFFCSTLPSFGFGPLSDLSRIAEIEHPLYCRPCGLHGRKECPEGHFKCSEIPVEKYVV